MKINNNKITVLHIIGSLRSGGAERQVVELLKGLSLNNKIVCHLALMSHDVHYKSVYDLNVKIHYLIRKTKKDPRIFIKLYYLCKYIKPDIIHSWGSMESVYSVPIAKIFGIKIINCMIRSAKNKIKFFEKFSIRSKITFPFSDLVVSNSKTGLKACKAPVYKSVCVHNGFDFERIKNIIEKESVKKIINLNSEKVIGMVATFSDYKDYKTFILAANIICEKRKDVIFLAIGDGKNLLSSQKYLKTKFKNNFKFLGRQKNVESIINVFDVGVLSANTKTIGEGISNSIMEYMAMGKPVVATKSGGTEELVLHEKTGFIIPAFDPNSLSERILQLLDNKELAIKMGVEGRKRIEKEFNLKKMTKSYITLYHGILKKKEI